MTAVVIIGLIHMTVMSIASTLYRKAQLQQKNKIKILGLSSNFSSSGN